MRLDNPFAEYLRLYSQISMNLKEMKKSLEQSFDKKIIKLTLSDCQKTSDLITAKKGTLNYLIEIHNEFQSGLGSVKHDELYTGYQFLSRKDLLEYYCGQLRNLEKKEKSAKEYSLVEKIKESISQEKENVQGFSKNLAHEREMTQK